MKSIFSLSLLSGLAAAVDFQWSHDGKNYFASEIDRIDKEDDALGLSTHIGEGGLGYFKVGHVDWPQFCRSIKTDDYEPGAYVVASLPGQLVIAKAYQLMEDPAQAFMTGILGDCEDSYKAFPGGAVPVAPVVGDGPLAGLRFAAKDLFHVKGVRTSAGSKSHYLAYPPQNHTSGIVLKNIEAGAQLVGKTKTTAFALTTTHNGWEVDYHDPFNVRGDGYLTTAGSSSGSGAAVTAYDWIDFAIGSDTGGSVRGPATQGGLYGYRPSQGYYDLEDVVVCVLSLDTPGFFTRSPELFTKLFSVWSKDTELERDVDSFTMPTKMLHRTDIVELADEDAQKMLDVFFKKVEDHFNMTSVTIDLDELWMENAVNQSYIDYFDTVYLDLNSLESWDLNGEPLTRAFGEMTDGAAPPVDPSVNLTWTNGQNETIRSRYDEAIKRGQQWRDFYSEHVNPANPDTCSDSIIAYTYYTDVPANRQDLVPFDFTGGDVTGGFWNTLPQSYGGAPEIIVPFGQVQYFSSFTRRTEYRPITASFSAARGCDAVLFKMVDGLAEAGIIGEVLTGRLAYPL